MTSEQKAAQLLNELLLVMLSLFLVGAFAFEFWYKNSPCALCYMQRLGITCIALGLLFNLFFGIRTSHYAVSLLAILFSSSISVRQILIHLCPSSSPYAFQIFGLQLYTWAFILTCICLFGITCLLLLHEEEEEKVHRIRPLGYIGTLLLLLITLGNVVDSFLQCGIGLCLTR